MQGTKAPASLTGLTGPDERLYRAAFESATIPMLVVDDDGRYVDVNRAACELMGKPKAALVGSSMRDVSGEIKDSEAWRHFLRSGRSQGEFSFRDEGGTVRHLDYLSVARILPDRHLTILTDVTSRVVAEQRLREHEARFRAMLDHSSDAVGLLDPDGSIRYVSPAAERILGWPVSALVGKNCFDFIHPDDRGRVEEEVRKVFAEPGGSIRVQQRVIGLDGSATWVEAAVRNATDVPEVRGVIANWRDITDKVHAQQNAKAQEEQIRRLGRMEDLARLAGGIAHDFNNLLSVILSGIELALQETDLTSIHEELSDALTAGERAANLTRRLLAFGGRQLMQPRSLDLVRALGAMIPIVQRIVGEDVDVVVMGATKLPLVSIDPTQFEQVILNLVVNAKDAMPVGGRVVFELRALSEPSAENDRSRSYVVIAVADNGTGMDEETKARLFEPFFTTKPEGRGTGLGLATVFGIMHQSGGRIAVESEKGRGTRFELFFPAESSTAAASPSVPAPADVPRGHETLLVVDDDSLVRSAAAAVLRRYGYEVLEAGSAGDALLIAEQHPYEIHAVVTDVVMPRMNGHILAERLKAMRPGLKVLITSGYTDDALLERGVETETFAFVPKPFTPSLLVSSIRALFDGSERP